MDPAGVIISFFRFCESPLGLAVSRYQRFSDVDTIFYPSIYQSIHLSIHRDATDRESPKPRCRNVATRTLSKIRIHVQRKRKAKPRLRRSRGDCPPRGLAVFRYHQFSDATVLLCLRRRRRQVAFQSVSEIRDPVVSGAISMVCFLDETISRWTFARRRVHLHSAPVCPPCSFPQ